MNEPRITGVVVTCWVLIIANATAGLWHYSQGRNGFAHMMLAMFCALIGWAALWYRDEG